jgi:hypothetical protein
MIFASEQNDASSQEARRAKRRRVQVTVDVKPLKTQDVDNILFGQGFEDLNFNSLSMSRPRHGMERVATIDLSVSGLCLTGYEFKAGTAAVLDLHLPQDSVVIKALVEIVWVKVDGQQSAAGCRFAAIQENGVERMRNFLRENN